MDDFIIYGLAAAKQAAVDSGWIVQSDEDKYRTGVLIGSGIGGLDGIEQASILVHEKGPRRLSPFFIPGRLINLVSGYASIEHGYKGPNHAVVTACATGAHAIGDAARLIALDGADVMLAGGAEAAVCRIGIAGFNACRALSTGFNDTPERASRPYDRDRDGFVMGEGAGVVMLEDLEHAKARGAKIYGEVKGYAPSLEWVRILGGSGGSRVAAAAADPAGNLYLTGSTGAMNFPTAGSGQNLPGGSPLYRIDPAGSAALLFPPGLSAITAFAASPRDVKTLFAASGASIWRSDDSGASWATLATLPNALRIWSIAPSASDPRVMYAGSGPNGLYKSVDGGQTWLASNEGLSPTSAGALNVYQVWIDPVVADVVFISTELGLWRSDSAGAAWVRVATAHNDPPMALMFSGSAIYASVGGQVLKSTDDGATFAVLSALPDLSSPTSLIADPFNAGVFYAGSVWGVYRSADAAATWTRVVSGQCASLAADANRPMIYASMAYANGVIRSSDGFQTSTPVGPPVATPGALTPANGAMFVVTTSSSDGFVTKLDPEGAIVYSTYLGGSGSDSPAAIATASDGSVYVAGTTYSRDFPVTPG